MKKIFTTLALLFILPLALMAQDYQGWIKDIQKFESQFEQGKYYVAASGINRQIRRQLKKGELVELIAPNRALSAKFRAALGYRIEAGNTLLAAEKEWLANQKDLPDSVQIVANLIYSGTAFELKKYNLAFDYLLRAEIFVNDKSDRKGLWNQIIKIKKIELYIELMNFESASALIDGTIEYQRGLTNRTEKVYNAKKQAYQFKKVKKKIYRKRLSQFGYLKVLKADIELKSGDIFKADTLYTDNYWGLFEGTKKNDLSYLANWYGQIRVNQIEGDEQAPRDLKKLRNRYANNIEVNVPNNYYFEIFESELRAYLDNEDYGRFNSGAKQFKREAIKNFSKKSANWFLARYVFELSDLYKSNFKQYDKHMSTLYEEINMYYDSTDLDRYSFLMDLATAKLGVYDFNSAEGLYKELIGLVQANTSDSSTIYYLQNLKLGEFYLKYTTHYDWADSLFSTYFDPAVRRQFHPFHPKYAVYLNAYGLLNEKLDRFQEAFELYAEASRIQRKKFGHFTSENGKELMLMARAQVMLGNYPEAENNLKEAKEAFERSKNTKSADYVLTLQAYGELQALNGDYLNAEKNLESAYEIAKRNMSKDEMLKASTHESLAELYISTGKYDEAEDILKKIIILRTKKLGIKHVDLIKPYDLLGQLYLVQGKMIESERAVSKSSGLAKELLGDTSVVYIKELVLLGEVYANMGNDEKAIATYNEAMEKITEKFDAQYILIADILIKRTRVEIRSTYEALKVLAALDRAGDIIRMNINEHHPKFAEVVELKAMVYIKQKRFDEALIQLQAANLIYTSSYGGNHVKTADNRVMVARLYHRKGDYVNALLYYDQALASYSAIFSKEHPKYVSTLSKKGQTYFAQKNYKEAADLLMSATQTYLDYIEKYFPSLSEAEKSKYWNTIRGDFEIFNSLAIKYYKEDPRVLGQMYNNHLATKALLLSSSIKLKERILRYGSPELISQYKKWIEKRDLLSQSLAMSSEELKEKGIDREELENEINQLERSLSESTKDFARNYESKPVTWIMVKNSLGADEAAVEMIRFNYFDKQLSDSVIYAALVVNSQTKGSPEIVILDNGRDLESKWFSYYRNNIKYKKEDLKSYGEYWQLLDAKLLNKKVIYFSGDGVYNQVNPETFRKQNGIYLIDKYKFYFVSNTKDIVNRIARGKEIYSNNTAVFIGNPKFEIADSTGAGTNSITSVEPLPGAEVEVKEAAELLDKGKWKTEVYVGDKAVEGLLRELDSPRVLHLSTHGFFMEDRSSVSENDIDMTGDEAPDNPLLRSGLLFTGAAHLLNAGNVYEFNREDGVLTAYEAMNLQLDNTELVVLSACETGRGEVRAGEGVYGLQRAFLVAGAQNVIMTLFKVDDEVTRELIDLFYQEWLKTGDKRKAFIYAKKVIRDKYESPIFWGSFILIGLD